MHTFLFCPWGVNTSVKLPLLPSFFLLNFIYTLVNIQKINCEIISVILEYSRSIASPDGFSKSIVTVNGSFPGPTIRGNVNDLFLINIFNMLHPTEELSVHFHGILQKGTVWSDGASEITNCPIAYGGNHTYTFRATERNMQQMKPFITALKLSGFV